MRGQATTRHKYTADLWNFTEETVITELDGEEVATTERSYYFSKKIKLTMGVDTLQRMKIFADEPIALYSRIRNVSDISGVNVLQGAVWQVTSTESVLSAMGLVEGYRMQAQLIQGV